MKTKLIPIKNRIFNTEKEFLEQKRQQGFCLEKKSLFFYHFKKATAKEVTYAIDLVPGFSNLDEIESLPDWVTLSTQKTGYKKMVKIYYCSEKKGLRLLVDNGAILKYYNYQHQLFLLLFYCFLFPVLLFFVLATAQIFVPFFLIYSSIFLLLPSLYCLLCHLAYDKAIKCLSVSSVVLTGNEMKYTIHFKNITPQQIETLENILSEFGSFRKLTPCYYRIQSPLDKGELLNELSSMVQMDPDTIQIVDSGDFYLFI